MRGHTLIELTAILAVMAVGSSLFLPAMRGQRERAAVLEARETVAAMIGRTRTVATAAGGATLRVDGDAGMLRVLVGDSVVAHASLPPRVHLATGGGGSLVEIGFNALGLGVFANETLELRSGAARARLVVSTHGRVRRE